MADFMPEYQSSDEEKPKENLNKKDQGANLTGWNELFLKDQLKRAIRECGFEHPSEVQVEAIPLALQGQDILCQAKSGMGKTAVFVISILNQIVPQGDSYQPHQAIITCHTRELAHQIFKDFKRLGRYFKKPELRYGCYFGGISLEENQAELKDPNKTPHIIISTPGRLYDLAKHKLISFQKCKFFVVDECDKVLGNPKMRADIQDIFIKTPHNKQVMMFSATMPQQMKKDCKKFLQKESQIFIDEGKLILHGLAQFYVYINENKKFEKLTHLLDTLAFNQMIIFVNRVDRAKKLTELLRQKLFNPICIHSQLKQEERIKNYDLFKANGSRLLVATDLFGRGIDIQRVNLVINYDFPTDRDTYLHRVGRAGRFGTKGLAINFIRADEQENQQGTTDKSILMDVQNGFKVKISELPKELDTSFNQSGCFTKVVEILLNLTKFRLIIEYCSSNRMKIRNSGSGKHLPSKFEPYKEIPFSPIKCLKPVLQRIHSDPQVVTRHKKVRGLAKKVIEGHFAHMHQLYKNKQNAHVNSFKIKTKKKDISSNQSLQIFFQQKSNARQRELRHMHQQYLKDIRRELQTRKDQSQTESEWNKQQKIINEYNIVYEYKVVSLPADLVQ